jgi:hypothetical protein
VRYARKAATSSLHALWSGRVEEATCRTQKWDLLRWNRQVKTYWRSVELGTEAGPQAETFREVLMPLQNWQKDYRNCL